MKKTLKIDNGFGVEYTFKIVDEIPDGYVVWNIGRHNFPFEKMIPLCLVDKNYNVDVEKLLAFECVNEDVAFLIMKVAGRQTINKKKILDFMK